MNIQWMFSGESQGYHINMDGEQIHFTKDVYERDMFIAELKGRLKIAKEQHATQGVIDEELHG